MEKETGGKDSYIRRKKNMLDQENNTRESNGGEDKG